MTITRKINGNTVEIKLTDDEVRHAYDEKREEYLRDDIEGYLDCNVDGLMDEFEDMTEKQIRAMIPQFLEYYMSALDNGACDLWTVVADSVCDCIRDYQRELE